MKIIGLYFTGTGNTKYVAELTKSHFKLLGHEMDLFSIELKKNKPENIFMLLENYDLIGIFYPIYASDLPKIFRKYLDELIHLVNDKKLAKEGFSITTVALFSGDGALVAKRYFDDMGILLKWAYNIQMPCNINIPFPSLRIPSKKREDRLKVDADIKINTVVNAIVSGKSYLAGTGFLAKVGGRMQRSGESYLDKYEIKINNEICTKCGLCVRICPMGNLELSDKLTTNNNCTLCLRCLHNCPAYAIRLINKKGRKPFKQFRGLEERFYDNMV